jgi:hypothetical protein
MNISGTNRKMLTQLVIRQWALAAKCGNKLRAEMKCRSLEEGFAIELIYP